MSETYSGQSQTFGSQWPRIRWAKHFVNPDKPQDDARLLLRQFASVRFSGLGLVDANLTFCRLQLTPSVPLPDLSMNDFLDRERRPRELSKSSSSPAFPHPTGSDWCNNESTTSSD